MNEEVSHDRFCATCKFAYIDFDDKNQILSIDCPFKGEVAEDYWCEDFSY